MTDFWKTSSNPWLVHFSIFLFSKFSVPYKVSKPKYATRKFLWPQGSQINDKFCAIFHTIFGKSPWFKKRRRRISKILNSLTTSPHLETPGRDLPVHCDRSGPPLCLVRVAPALRVASRRPHGEAHLRVRQVHHHLPDDVVARVPVEAQHHEVQSQALGQWSRNKRFFLPNQYWYR